KEAEGQRADDGTEAAHQEQGREAAHREPLGSQHTEHAGRQQRDREQEQRDERFGSDQGLLSLARLTSLSSIVMRRFFDLASRIAVCSAELRTPKKDGTSWAGELSAWVQMTTWSGRSLPYLRISR